MVPFLASVDRDAYGYGGDMAKIGDGSIYVIAEMSASHNQDFECALLLVDAAAKAGADAVKTQTFKPETLTIDCNSEPFVISGGTPWDGRTLYELYQQAYMPWEWQEEVKKRAAKVGIDFISTVYDKTALKHLEKHARPIAYKIASFENNDIPLLKRVAEKGLPIILSTGMATLTEIREAVNVIQSYECEVILLHCVSAYPAEPCEMNLRTIQDLAEQFKVTVGISDHTLGIAIPVAAVALGARVVEKHLRLSTRESSLDDAFSLDPDDFRWMVEAVRSAADALGEATYGASEREATQYRRSLFVVEDIAKGEEFAKANIRSIRPADGLEPKYYQWVLGTKAPCDIARGTPLTKELLDGIL